MGIRNCFSDNFQPNQNIPTMYVSSIPRQVLEIPTINHGNFYLEKILFRKKKFLQSTVGTIALPPLGSSAIGRQRDSGGMFQTTVACAGMFTFPCGQESTVRLY